ncbi:MAG: hypothetical protein ABEI86_06055 [Halobacteriaceae archaeon]
MVDKNTVYTIGFRAYGISVGVAGVFTALLAFELVSITPTLFGGMWLALAIAGGVIAVGLTLNRDEVVLEDRSEARCQRWNECMFTGWLLNIYLIAAAIWAGVSFGWFIGGQSAAGIPAVGVGWIAIAAYGGFVAVGMTLYHFEYVTTALNPAEELES